MNLTKEQESALRTLESAAGQLKKGLTLRSGGAKSEANYGAAYTACVRLGVKPPIRKKYRG